MHVHVCVSLKVCLVAVSVHSHCLCLDSSQASTPWVTIGVITVVTWQDKPTCLAAVWHLVKVKRQTDL